MIVKALLLLLIAPCFLSGKVPSCKEHDNHGVFNEFGSLPSKLWDSTYYYQVIMAGNAFTTFNAKANLKAYTFEYMEFRSQRGMGDLVYSYYRILYKDQGHFRTIDYVRVDPKKWETLEDALLDADQTPSADRTLKISFLLSDCSCVVRTYNLGYNDIVSRATTSVCAGLDRPSSFNNPHSIPHARPQIAPNQIDSMQANDVFPLCNARDNVGVFNEFGPLPMALRNSLQYHRVHSTGFTSNKLTLVGTLWRYTVEYSEYMSVYGVGSDFYAYLTLTIWDSVTYTYKILDYLRVTPTRWKQIQEAILKADSWANDNGIIRMMYFTSDCKCVQRRYNIRSVDIPAEATTWACNGDPLTTPTHNIPQRPKTDTVAPDVTLFGLLDKYPGCKLLDNNGVLDVFGPLPTNLFDVRYYYEAISTTDSYKKYELWSPLEKYVVTFSKYLDQQFTWKSYSFLTLYYHEGSKFILIDYLRVNPDRWTDVQMAFLKADAKPDRFRKLRVRYLTADCTCKMRVYDLNAMDVVGEAKTMTCDGLIHTESTQPQ